MSAKKPTPTIQNLPSKQQGKKSGENRSNYPPKTPPSPPKKKPTKKGAFAPFSIFN